ncbi:hypothetical protein NIGALANA_210 [Bacillus phage Nigalana]|uniref:hypothetical protein n=1 Tax=Bacillus phage Nigalana TaxID=1805951 RepID=UPI0007A76FD8|nr:hypothetical protein BI005_gp210 [Bacillus phage Nigalana]AMW61360.1 hypothetical protein NIGALANA_210 [Bacillus phage Nigalana]
MAEWVRVEYTETTTRECYVKANNLDEIRQLVKDGKVYEEENIETDILLEHVSVMTEEEIEEAGL